MTGEPIELNRGEVKALWDFMARVDGTLLRIEAKLDDHETRLRHAEQEITSQRSERAFTRWMLPIFISLGALAVSLWSYLKRANGG